MKAACFWEKYRMKLPGSVVALIAGSIAATANAAPPMSPESIAVLEAALPQCSGGWIELVESGQNPIKAAKLLPRLRLLSRPSSELDQTAGSDLYQIARGFLAPGMKTIDGMLDGKPSLTCPAHPREATELMEYLVGDEPGDLRAPLNAFDWLGLGYATGATSAPDPVKARRYYLRARMHSSFMKGRWSDGIDNDLLANIQRAGLRPYLDALVRSERLGAAAKAILAEAALPTDPPEARRLLRSQSDVSLGRLIELEEQGRVPFVADADDIAFWAEATRTLFGYRKYAARMLKGVRSVNGGTIPTSAQRPTIESLRPYLDLQLVADANVVRDPIAVRALVTPQGRAIHIEACQALPPQSIPVLSFNALLDAARLYAGKDLARLPALPVTRIAGRPAYGWVLLPAVQFLRSDDGKLDIRFEDLASSRCVHSAIADAPPPPSMTPPAPPTK